MNGKKWRIFLKSYRQDFLSLLFLEIYLHCMSNNCDMIHYIFLFLKFFSYPISQTIKTILAKVWIVIEYYQKMHNWLKPQILIFSTVFHPGPKSFTGWTDTNSTSQVFARSRIHNCRWRRQRWRIPTNQVCCAKWASMVRWKPKNR